MACCAKSSLSETFKLGGDKGRLELSHQILGLCECLISVNMRCTDVGEANPDIAGIGVSLPQSKLARLRRVDSRIVLEKHHSDIDAVRFCFLLWNPSFYSRLRFRFGWRRFNPLWLQRGKSFKRREVGPASFPAGWQ